MFAVFDARAVAGHKVKPAIDAAQNGVRVVVAAGVEFISDSALGNERAAGTIPFKHLNPVTADRVKPVVINQQPLRPAPAQAGGDHLERIEHAVTVLVAEPAHCIPIAHEQSSLAVEC